MLSDYRLCSHRGRFKENKNERKVLTVAQRAKKKANSLLIITSRICLTECVTISDPIFHYLLLYSTYLCGCGMGAASIFFNLIC